MTSQDGVPVSGQRSFTDPDQFHAAIRGDNGLLSFHGRGTYSAELTTVQIGRLTLQRGRENLPVFLVMAPNRVGMLGWLATLRCRLSGASRCGVARLAVPRPACDQIIARMARSIL